MWLEETAWLWLPLACGAGVWGLWSLVSLKAEVRRLRERLARLEDESAARSNKEQKAA
jgi:hypothetical protein